MEFYQGNIYHVYNRGNQSRPIFYDAENYILFLEKMRRFLNPYCDVLAWCLMPNHFHWMIHVHDNKGEDKKNDRVSKLNKNIGIILRSYTRAINRRYSQSGSLFQSKTKAKNVNTDRTTDNNYALTCFFYIHQNPLRAGLEQRLGEWKFSSYKDYAGLRQGSLCNKKLARELLSLPTDIKSFVALSNETIPKNLINGIFDK